jgi:hypothetical protein
MLALAAWAKIGGVSPTEPRSTLPVLMASIIGGPEENSTHFTAMPRAAKCFSKIACWRAITRTPVF